MTQITKITLAAVTVFLVLYDIGAAIIGGPSSTISAVLYQWAESYPIIPFALGVVSGHFFWGIKE